MKSRWFVKIIMRICAFPSTYKWKINQAQRKSMKLYEKYSNVDQYGSTSMKTIKTQRKILMFFWKHLGFLVRVNDSDLNFREAGNPSKWPPGHSCLRKCICEERLSAEKITFWAPSIFQKLKVPDVRLSDSVDSRSNLWVSIQKPQTVELKQFIIFPYF